MASPTSPASGNSPGQSIAPAVAPPPPPPSRRDEFSGAEMREVAPGVNDYVTSDVMKAAADAVAAGHERVGRKRSPEATPEKAEAAASSIKDDGEKVAAGETARDPTTGQFVKADSAPADGTVAPPAPVSSIKDAAAAPAPAPFKFVGKDYASQAEAENAHKTLSGQLRAERERYTDAHNKAAGWSAAYERLVSRLKTADPTFDPENAQSYPSVKPTAATPAPVEVKLADQLDWKSLAEVEKIHGPHAVLRLVVEDLEKGLTEKYEARLKHFESRYEAQGAQVKETQAALEAFTTAASYSLEGGAPYYPELHDPAKAQAIIAHWHSLPFPAEVKLTPQMVDYAILSYRASAPAPTAPAMAAPPIPSAAPPPMAFAPNPASAGVLPPGDAPQMFGNGHADPHGEFKRQLRLADQRDPMLGVSR